MVIAMLSVLIISFSIIMYARNMEKKRWNRGICLKCGKPWKLYAVDSQGGRMYSCGSNHTCDISYSVDK